MPTGSKLSRTGSAGRLDWIRVARGWRLAPRREPIGAAPSRLEVAGGRPTGCCFFLSLLPPLRAASTGPAL